LPEIIIQTKISPPKPPANIIQRESLVGQLKQNLGKNVILVCAPAGYGKTTLVQDLLSNASINYAWLHAGEDMNDFYTFISYLIHSMKKIKESFGDATLSLVDSLKESKLITDMNSIIRQVTGNFINEFFQSFKSEIILVIDDFHELNNYPWLNLTFENILVNMPDNLHVIITSRTLPEFNLSALRSKRKIFELSPKDLIFRREEIEKILRNLYSLNYSKGDVEFLEKSLGGWITGIHLILQAYGSEFNKKNFETSPLPENVFDFFANEIFQNQDKQTQTFLLTTAHLNNFDNSLCDSLLEIQNSSEILRELLSKNIFIEATTVQNEKSEYLLTYNYQALFKAYLISKSYSVMTEDEIGAILKKIYLYYLDRNDRVSAINYALLAKDYTAALLLITAVFQKLFNEGKFEILWKWLGQFAEEVNTNPYLMYFKGILNKYYSGELENAISLLEGALKIFESAKNEEYVIKCHLVQVEILINLGKTDAVLRILNLLKDSKTSPENRARFLYFLGYAHFVAQNYDEALTSLNNSLEISNHHDFKDIKIDISNVLGNINLIRGEFIKSIFYYEQIVEKTTNIFKKFIAFGNLSILYARSGKFDRAREYFEKASELVKLFSTPIFESALMRVEYNLRFECRDFEAAQTLAEKINSFAKRINDKNHIFLSYLFLGETCYYQHKHINAYEYFDLSKTFADEGTDADQMTINLAFALLNKESNGNKGTEKTLLDSYAYYDDRKFIFDKTNLCYHIADFYVRTNQTETGTRYLEECLKTSQEKDYLSFLIREFFYSRKIFDFAISNKLNKDFIKALTAQAIEIADIDWLSGESRERLNNEIENICDIRLTSFGEIEFKVRGRVIPEDKWIRKKRKLILAYLMLFPNNPLTKDKIIDLFYPETPLESVDNIFHQTISNIRSALKPDAEIKPETESGKTKSSKTRSPKETVPEPSFIIYEDKMLKLNPDYIYWVDALEFNRLFNLAGSLQAGDEKRIEYCKKAIDLYKGEMLAGYYEPWCEDLRQEYSNKFISLCEELIAALKQKKSYEQIAIYSERLIQADKLNENGYLNVIEAYVKVNSINRAREKFSQMLRTYEDELGEKPPKEILDKIKVLLM